MFGLGPMEVGIVLIVLVLLFGRQLPGVMRSLGSSVVEFKKGISGQCSDLNEIENEVKDNFKEIKNGLKNDAAS